MLSSRVAEKITETAPDLPVGLEALPPFRDAKWQIVLYFVALKSAITFGMPSGLLAIPIQFYLKDALHLPPQKVAAFGFAVGLPGFLLFLMGFLRDRWRPFGWGDRGYFVLASAMVLVCYGTLFAGTLNYARLLFAVVVATFAFGLLGAATQGLQTALAQRTAMTGRLTSLAMLSGAILGILATLAGGWLVAHSTLSMAFVLASASVGVLFGMAFWKPHAVFADVADVPKRREGNRHALLRLLRHRPLWPAAMISLLWNLAPGWGTAQFYFLTNTLKLSPQGWATFNAELNIGTGSMAALYIYFCRRFTLQRMLWFGIVVGSLCSAPFLLMRTPAHVFALAIPIALLAGVANMSIHDLVMRSCPPDLEGTALTFISVSTALIVSTGDLFGVWLYQRGGFGLAVTLTIITSACALPFLRLLPRSLIATREGEQKLT